MLKYVLFFIFIIHVTCGFSQSAKIPLETEIRSALKKADLFLSKNMDSHFLYLIIYGLEQHGYYSSSFSIANKLSKSTIYGDEQNLLKYIERWTYRKNKIDTLQISKIEDKTDKLMVSSLFADQMKLSTESLDFLKQMTDSNQNPRVAAHAALVINWLKCLKQDYQLPNCNFYENNIKLQLLPAIGTSDTGMEAAFGLIQLGDFNSLTPAYIQKIISAQNPDGGWKWGDDNKENTSHQHPTTLAVYLLSAALYKENFNVYWLK